MTKIIVSVKDAKVGFGPVTEALSKEVAYREFANVANTNAIMKANSNDFALYKLGTIDSDTGIIIPEMELIVDASDCIRKAS